MTISVDEVEALASRAAGGLRDFGGDDHLPGLQVLLDAAATSPHRGDALDARVRQSAVTALAARLASQAGWSARPDVLRAPLPPQVAIVGLPRSGTTALHQIMAADPAFQWIPSWLAPRPGPRPAHDTWERDPLHHARVDAYRAAGPNPLHDVAPDDPEECIQVMQQSFVNMNWVSSQAVPAYHEWFVEQDERPSYRRYADNLRLIGADDRVRPWLLKNPSHTFGMAAMLDEFPDAVFVHLYRDPAESIVSGCSLITSIAGGPGAFTPAELGAHRLRIWALAADRFLAARAAAPDRTFVDVDYRALVADPLATVRDVYRRLCRELTPDAEAAMQRWATSRPKDQYGPHHYSAADFGLTAEAIRERTANYVEQYAVDRPVGEGSR